MSESISNYEIIIVPGLHGSGINHWQSRWAYMHPEFNRVEQDNWHVPHLETWSNRIAEYISNSTKPVVLVAHSFGCLASVHATLQNNLELAAALLVAPADTSRFSINAQDLAKSLPYLTFLVGSGNDPWMSIVRAKSWAKIWGATYIDAGKLGHINADSKLEDWPQGYTYLLNLIQQIQIKENNIEFFSEKNN